MIVNGIKKKINENVHNDGKVETMIKVEEEEEEREKRG